MAGDHLGGDVDAGVEARPQQLGDAFVDGATGAAQERFVGDLLDEDMPEDIAGVGPRPLFEHERAVHQAAEEFHQETGFDAGHIAEKIE